MKLFLLRTLTFVFVLLVLNVVLLALIEKLYFKEYRRVDLGYHKYLLADSHGVPLRANLNQYGIYNFSSDGDSYADLYAKAQYLMSHSSIDTLYISVDNHMLSSYRERLDNATRSIIYKTPKDFDNRYSYFIAKYIKRYVVYFNSGYRDIINTYLRSLIKNVSGQTSAKPSWAELSYTAQKDRARKRFKQQFTGTVTSTSLTATLQKIINLCHQHNVVIIGIRFPLTQVFLKAMGTHSYGADAYFRKRNIMVYDFQKKYQHQNEYFFDEDHLNEEGGAVFAREFSNM